MYDSFDAGGRFNLPRVFDLDGMECDGLTYFPTDAYELLTDPSDGSRYV